MIPELTSSYAILGVAALLGYGLGSVPFGIVIARAFGLGDLRSIGSGNIGATNVLRTGNKLAAFLTLLLDSGKGAIAVILARVALGAEDAVQLAALGAFFGHCFPVWLRFKGGKGVATYLGTLLALIPFLGLAACATWVVIAAVFRISSLAALMAALLSPLWVFLLNQSQFIGLCVALALLIMIRHEANIKRLLSGSEPKIGSSKKP